MVHESRGDFWVVLRLCMYYTKWPRPFRKQCLSLCTRCRVFSLSHPLLPLLPLSTIPLAIIEDDEARRVEFE